MDWAALGVGDAYSQYLPENQIYSACQQCNTQCGIKVKIVDGLVAKIDGNPYSPWTMTPQIAYKTPITDAAIIEGAICPKGQAGIQALYDPYRIVKVLKRAGKRGENKWQTIPFDQAVNEIVNGGNLFGEGNVEGLKDICVLKDPKIAKELAEDAAQVADHKMELAAFKAKHADNLKYLIDPDHPDLGPKNNQFVLNTGRLKAGRDDLLKRFVNGALGSENKHGHTTVCQGSLYFTCKAMSYQFEEGDWGGSKKFYWQADTGNCEFILFVGANLYEANYGPPLRNVKLTQGIVDNGMKIAVVDPRCSKGTARAWKWLPVRPNGVAAVGLGMMHWIIENQRYDARYLANANKAAAKADGEPTWTQTAWLVKINPDGSTGTYLRGSDLGLPKEKRPKKKGGGDWEFDAFMVYSGGAPKPFDPNSETDPVEGDLLVDTEIKGIKVKSVLQILRENLGARKLSEWAKLADISGSGFGGSGPGVYQSWQTGGGRYPSGRLPAHLRLLQRPDLHDPEHPHRQPRLDGGPVQAPPPLTLRATKKASPLTSPSRAASSSPSASPSSGTGPNTTRAPSSRATRPSAPGIRFPATSTRKSSPASATPTPIPSRRSCSTWDRRSIPCRRGTNSSRSSPIPRSCPCSSPPTLSSARLPCTPIISSRT